MSTAISANDDAPLVGRTSANSLKPTTPNTASIFFSELALDLQSTTTTPRSDNAHPPHQDQEAPWPRLGRPRSRRQAQEAPRWSRSRRWSAPPPHQHGQVPPGLLWKGWYALLPQDPAAVLEARPQPRQALDSRSRGEAPGLPRRQVLRQGSRHRPALVRLRQAPGQGPSAQRPRRRQGPLRQRRGRAQDQGGRRCDTARRLNRRDWRKQKKI